MREDGDVEQRSSADMEGRGRLQIVLCGKIELADGLDVEVTKREESWSFPLSNPVASGAFF